ncbi:hypothetical protein CLF_107898, partial [Clonorchis sinensis]
ALYAKPHGRIKVCGQLSPEFTTAICARLTETAERQERIRPVKLGSYVPINVQIFHGAHVRQLLKYTTQFAYAGGRKEVTPSKLVQEAATKLVAGRKSGDCKSTSRTLHLFPLCEVSWTTCKNAAA